MEQLKAGKVVIPESVEQAVAMVEVVQGKGATPQFAIDLMIQKHNGEISDEDVIAQITSRYV